MKRRDFVSMLIGATTAAIIVPKRVFSLPTAPRDFNTATMDYRAYFTSDHAWYLMTEPPGGLKRLSEEALKEMALQVRGLRYSRALALSIEPTKLLIARSL